MPTGLRIVIAEDNYLVREGTRRLLEDSGEVEVVAAVNTAAQLLAEVRRLQPDAVLTDIRMPDRSATGTSSSMEGIEAAHVIKSEHPRIGVVVLSQYADETYAIELLNRGASGLAYLLKDRVGDLDRLLHALHEVVTGGSVIDPHVVEALVARRARANQSPLSHLTPRELDVLRHMAQGMSNTAIAQALSLSESAVGKHINSIFAKLGLSTEVRLDRRVAAVLTFLRDSGLAPRSND